MVWWRGVASSFRAEVAHVGLYERDIRERGLECDADDDDTTRAVTW